MTCGNGDVLTFHKQPHRCVGMTTNRFRFSPRAAFQSRPARSPAPRFKTPFAMACSSTSKANTRQFRRVMGQQCKKLQFMDHAEGGHVQTHREKAENEGNVPSALNPHPRAWYIDIILRSCRSFLLHFEFSYVCVEWCPHSRRQSTMLSPSSSPAQPCLPALAPTCPKFCFNSSKPLLCQAPRSLLLQSKPSLPRSPAAVSHFLDTAT